MIRISVTGGHATIFSIGLSLFNKAKEVLQRSHTPFDTLCNKPAAAVEGQHIPDRAVPLAIESASRRVKLALAATERFEGFRRSLRGRNSQIERFACCLLVKTR